MASASRHPRVGTFRTIQSRNTPLLFGCFLEGEEIRRELDARMTCGHVPRVSGRKTAVMPGVGMLVLMYRVLFELEEEVRLVGKKKSRGS